MSASIAEPAFERLAPGVRRARLGRQSGARQLGLSLYELEPGARPWPYHYHCANEELLIVLTGTPSVRGPGGWRELRPGDVVAFPRGPDGAHAIANRSRGPARYLVLSEMNAPEVGVYPDSGKVSAMSRAPGSPGGAGEIAAWFRLADAVDYWEGEEGAEASP